MTNSDRGREGDKNPEILADVICTCPLMSVILGTQLPKSVTNSFAGSPKNVWANFFGQEWKLKFNWKNLGRMYKRHVLLTNKWHTEAAKNFLPTTTLPGTSDNPVHDQDGHKRPKREAQCYSLYRHFPDHCLAPWTNYSNCCGRQGFHI